MLKVLSNEYLGLPLTSAKIVPGDTRTAASGYIYKEYDMVFTSGGTTTVVVGDQIVGATDGATATIKTITLASGTWGAGTAAGTLRLKNVIGTFKAAGENCKVGAGTNEFTIGAGVVTEATDDYTYKNKVASAAVIQVFAQTALVTFDGSLPDQTLLKGMSLAANTQTTIVGDYAIRNLVVVDRVSGSASTIFIQYYFQ